MAVRIFTLAKELNMSSKDLMSFLATQGHHISNHMCSIPESVAAILRDRLKPKIKAPPPPPRPVPGSARPDAKPGVAAKPAAAAPRGPGEVAARHGGPHPVTGKPRQEAAKPGAPATARPAARAGETEADWEKKKEAKEREEKERQKEVPTKRRYFPTREDLYEMGPRFGGGRRRPGMRPRGKKEGPGEAAVATTERPSKIEVVLPITVKDLSAAMGIKGAAIIKALMEQGHPVHINQFLDEDLVLAAAIPFNIDIAFKKEAALEEATQQIDSYESKAEEMVLRAPVVTFLGHVDHGKTSLLDKIRSTNVTLKEAGGITQHLGAYRVDRGDIHVVFIDTPGHQAFTTMRARGANVTDIAVLVVAADDGVMPQTEEALNHARAAQVPIVVALNKIDKPAANPMRVKQQLAALGLQPVEWGGDTEVVEVSALTSQGLDTLIQTLSLTAEIRDVKANPKRPALGIVLEAEASTSRGVVAMVLIREGTLKLGDYVLCGSTHGRIRGMLLNGVTAIKEAGPSMPVKVTGLEEVPEAGEKIYVLDDVQKAREIAAERSRKKRESERAGLQSKITLENLFSTLKKDASQELRLILRADFKGSVEALKSSIEALSTDEVKVRILHSGVGAVTQDDILLATASQDANAIIIGFNVTADERARDLAEEKRVQIRTYDVIYKVLDDIKGALEARLAPQKQEEVHGHAEIRKVFKASKVGNIAGCLVTDGFVGRNDQIRLVRDGRIVHTGTLSSLKRVKDDAREVKAGFECGMKIANYDDIKESDVVEAFAIVEKPRQL